MTTFEMIAVLIEGLVPTLSAVVGLSLALLVADWLIDHVWRITRRAGEDV